MKHAGVLPHRYAKALFFVGKHRDILAKIQEDMSLFVSFLKVKPAFYHFFLSPEVSRKEKENKIDELFGDTFSNVFYNFLLVLLKNRRQDLILDISDAFQQEVDLANNRTKVYVTSAVELTPELKTEISQKLSQELNKEIVLISQVDSTLLGGIQINVAGKIIDSSIKGKLRKMRSVLMENSQEALN